MFLQRHLSAALVGIAVCWTHAAEAQVAGQHPDSKFLVRAARESEVRLFTPAGRHLQTFGRAGSGPGEFRGATALLRARDGALIVADSRRLLQLFYPKGRGFEYRRTVTLPVAVRSMCFLGTTLVVNPETGRATYVGTGLPLLRDMSDRLALVYTPALVPRLEVRTAQPRPSTTRR